MGRREVYEMAYWIIVIASEVGFSFDVCTCWLFARKNLKPKNFVSPPPVAVSRHVFYDTWSQKAESENAQDLLNRK